MPSRLCRPMCGGGTDPPLDQSHESGATPRRLARSPNFLEQFRKGIALPHIGRQSRQKAA